MSELLSLFRGLLAVEANPVTNCWAEEEAECQRQLDELQGGRGLS